MQSGWGKEGSAAFDEGQSLECHRGINAGWHEAGCPCFEGGTNFVGFLPIGKYDKWCARHGLARAFDQGLLLRIFNRGAANAENDHRATSGLRLSIGLAKSTAVTVSPIAPAHASSRCTIPACRNFFESMITIWGFSGRSAQCVRITHLHHPRTPSFPSLPITPQQGSHLKAYLSTLHHSSDPPNGYHTLG